jgi:D-alanyl-lipoteichoic acid acyltransferase DltB (MBOAT superfamily)
MVLVPKYILILALTITVDYFAAVLMDRAGSPALRKITFASSLVTTCLILMTFKYFDFVRQNISFFSAKIFHQPYTFEPLLLILPIGLSFHTFQSLSYVIEVYRRRQAPEKNIITYSLYVMFFPQLVAGPIERPQNLLHQFRENHDLDFDRLTSGLLLMGWGFFKKCVIANRLAPLVNQVYGAPETFSGIALALATVSFSFQIYGDFSGYSDIALGSAEIMGFRLMRNFESPYLSSSIGDFWKSWHISLSSWFKDYVYIPLGGNRATFTRKSLNLLVTFALSGLWHGANWTFVAWGAINSFYLVIETSITNFVPSIRIPRFVSISVVFILISFSWIFFRASSLRQSLSIIKGILILRPGLGIRDLAFSRYDTLAILASLAILAGTEVLQRRRFNLRSWIMGRPLCFRWSLYAFGLNTLLFLSAFHSEGFIYFQF